MDPEVRKKLIIPFVVFLAILAINTNTIINAVNQHNPTRIVIAAVSTVIVLGLLIFTVRKAGKGGNKPS
jgi:uncharacterized membrane protein YbhN (UPF0104 family)